MLKRKIKASLKLNNNQFKITVSNL